MRVCTRARCTNKVTRGKMAVIMSVNVLMLAEVNINAMRGTNKFMNKTGPSNYCFHSVGKYKIENILYGIICVMFYRVLAKISINLYS